MTAAGLGDPGLAAAGMGDSGMTAWLTGRA